jgi:hypothetical protein
MEGLLNIYGHSAFWPIMVLLGLPLTVIGLMLRRRARRRTETLAQAARAQRQIRDVQAGLVTLVGLWRDTGNGSGVLEEEPESEHRVLIERGAGAPQIADGTMVVVVGCATHQADDPRPAGYRGSPRIWVVETRGDGQFVSPDTNALARAAFTARTQAGLGAALFAAGVMVAIASCVIAWRASHDSYDETVFTDN